MSTNHSDAPFVRQHQRQLRNFLIDRHFQLIWVIRVAAITVLVVGVMGYFLYSTLAQSIDIVTMSQMSSAMTETAYQTLISRGDASKAVTLYVLVSSFVLLVLVLSGMTIVVTHRVAGPMYKIRRLLKTIHGDNLQLREKLRKGDELQQVFEELENTLSRLRESRRLDIEYIRDCSARLPENDEMEPVRKELQIMIDRYTASIEGSEQDQ